MSRYANIPIFLVDRGCPHQCAFCNQKKITNMNADITPQKAKEVIEKSLATMRSDCVEIAYFGGSFSGLSPEEQEAFLSLAYEFVKAGKVSGIRLSTRPDLINEKVLDRFVRYGVTTVELGAQSLDDEVLSLNQRGHTAYQTEAAAHMIRNRGFSLGLQMMIGLRGDSREKAMATARGIVKLGAYSTRIYPAVVLRGTLLEKWYHEGCYTPLSLEEAIDWCCSLTTIFEEAGVLILRMGLMASDSLQLGKELIAGPFHNSFGELVTSELMLREARSLLLQKDTEQKDILLFVSPKAVSPMIGHRRKNVIQLEKEFSFKRVNITPDDSLTGRNMKIVGR